MYIKHMSPTKWIRQAKWIKIAIIQFFNTVKTFNVRIFNPTIFALHTSGVKLYFYP